MSFILDTLRNSVEMKRSGYNPLCEKLKNRFKLEMEKTDISSSTLAGLEDWLLAPQSVGLTYCYSYLTLAGLLEHYECQKIPEGLNVNNIRPSLVKQRVSPKQNTGGV